MAVRNNAARLILAMAGAAAMTWAAIVFPVLWSEYAIVDVGQAVIRGEVFEPDVLAAVEAQTQGKSGSTLRSSVLGMAAVIRLRQAENAIRGGDRELIDRRLTSLNRMVRETLRNAPDDSFLWLALFWLDGTSNGVRPENVRFLRMSYELDPYEDWIAVKRNGVALAAFHALPKNLAARAISEFVGLVRWGLIPSAAEIAAGPARPLRGVLFPRLKQLPYEQRRAFADAIYGQGLDDVPVPGIPPPKPKPPIAMPVMPPNF